MMNIQVNGEPKQVSNDCSITDLLLLLEITGRRVAVELNQEIVPKSLHTTTILQENDCVEVVHAIGGG
ncbi:MAG TPA: sulfur carrier protein ThiS [Agitococcus sp.]|nr:sulfur carrier protein ThiS [Agitococcus sp.]